MNAKRGFRRLTAILSMLAGCAFLIAMWHELESFWQTLTIFLIGCSPVWILYLLILWIVKGFTGKRS